MSLLNFKKKSPKKAEEESSQLTEAKKDMIKGVEDLSKTSVKEVMIPRIDVDFIAVDTPTNDLISKIISTGHSRFPVYQETIDKVIGVLYVKDLLKNFADNKKIDLSKIIRKPYFVPESKRIDVLLGEFKRNHLHIAIAIDEYGGTSGIITMEDIIEEIVGDIQDEFDKEREDIIVLNENSWLCDARLSLDNLNEELGAAFPNDNFDSLGGFVFDLFGKVPVKFEKASWKNFDFIVHDMEGHGINVIKVIKNNENDEKDEE